MSTKKIVYGGIFAALVLVSTWLIKVPISIGSGYIHLGDAMVYLSGAFLGPFGALAAGIGSLLADILAGWASYAIPTFIVKTLDALVVALIFMRIKKASDSKGIALAKFAVSAVLGGLVMVSGYFAYELVVYPEYALVNVPFNAIQAIAGVIIAGAVYPLLSQIKWVDL